MNTVRDIEIEEVTAPALPHNTGGERRLDTVRRIRYTSRVYSQTTGTYYDHEGQFIVAVGYRGMGSDGPRTYTPGGSRLIYQAELVITTRFGADIFVIAKNRWGVDSNSFSVGDDLGYHLITQGLSGFDLLSRERLVEKIFQALSDITGHPKEYIKNKERYVMNRRLQPRYYTNPLIFE
jgi:hypothetical protein